MERTKLNGYVHGEECHDLFGEFTHFRNLCSKFVTKVVIEGNKWFAFHTKVSKDQVDIFKTEDNNGGTFGTLTNMGSPYNSVTYKVSLYKYMLSEFLCYIEYPIVIRSYQLQESKNSFEKMLVTSNIHVVAEWLGITVEEASCKYGSRLIGSDVDNECNYFPYLKLYTVKGGERKVTRPRKDLDLGISGMRLVPVFALKAGVDALYKKLLSGTYTVTFVKDSGQEREISTTFNKELALKYYPEDQGFVNRGFENVYVGDFLNNPNLDRGYIRVFELGSSIFDTPTRSINYARIVRIVQEEPNMAFSHIDLDKVIDTFEYHVMRMPSEELSTAIDMLEAMSVGTERKIGNSVLSTASDLCSWANMQETLLSTVFLRDLALFMIAFPDLFGGYTGSEQKVQSQEDLMSPDDFDLDFM